MRERKRNRKPGFDYSSSNIYFVTTCTKDKECFFGSITDGKLLKTDAGGVVEKQWYWLFKRYWYIKSHAFVLMPNHIHGILEINLGLFPGLVGTGRDLSLPELDSNYKIKSLSELMGAFKTTSSKKIRLLGIENFAWQRSFHDHIIKDEQVYYQIKNYIKTNPQNWASDALFY